MSTYTIYAKIPDGYRLKKEICAGSIYRAKEIVNQLKRNAENTIKIHRKVCWVFIYEKREAAKCIINLR